jgi:6-phosphofructokinase 1
MSKKVAVLTSGGDAPGMNAAVRAIVRTGLHYGFEMYGVQMGFEGLINGNWVRLMARDVGGIIQYAGTFLGSARSVEFTTPEGQDKALRKLAEQDFRYVVVIGGNGSQKGAHILSKAGLAVVGVASTIDNDLYGSDITIGVDTALNIALEAIDRLRVTRLQHGACWSRSWAGTATPALMSGLAGGPEASFPERSWPRTTCRPSPGAHERGKKHALIVVAEGLQQPQKLRYFKQHESSLL